MPFVFDNVKYTVSREIWAKHSIVNRVHMR